MDSTFIVFITLIVLTALAVWIYSLYDLNRCNTFTKRSKIAWFVIFLFFPVLGPIAYFSTKKTVEKYTRPPAPDHLKKLIEDEK